MSTLGERKCALLLLSLRESDRRQLLARLPGDSARTIRALIKELERLPVPVGELAGDLLADEVRGLTARTSPDLEQLVALANRLPPAWFARVLAVWTGVDRSFCLAMLEDAQRVAVKQELDRLSTLPPRLVEAIKAEAAALAAQRAEAA